MNPHSHVEQVTAPEYAREITAEAARKARHRRLARGFDRILTLIRTDGSQKDYAQQVPRARPGHR